jgi:hypothetical protein
MNFPRVAVAALVSWIVYLGAGFLVHAVLLKPIYLEHARFMRPEAEANSILPVGFGVALIGFFAFAYAYAKGYEGSSGVQEGIRFGVLVGILLCCFSTIWDYMVWPASRTLAALWMIDYILEFALYGLIVGMIYKPVARPSRSAARV